MSANQDLFSMLSKAFASDPLLVESVKVMLQYLREHDCPSGDWQAFSRIVDALKDNFTLDDLLRAIVVMSTSPWQLVEKRWVFTDPSSNKEFVLEAAHVKALMQQEPFAHPETRQTNERPPAKAGGFGLRLKPVRSAFGRLSPA